MPRFYRRIFSCFRPHKPSNPNSTSDLSTVEQKLQQGGSSVVVELFSSQGCATSPQAEMLISRLGRGDFQLEDTNVVVLAYHVDYWDYMGWKDPYGSSQWTVRQKAYVESLGMDTMFTPQLVVQGRSHLVGTDQDALLKAIKTAERFPPLSMEVRTDFSD